MNSVNSLLFCYSFQPYRYNLMFTRNVERAKGLEYLEDTRLERPEDL